MFFFKKIRVKGYQESDLKHVSDKMIQNEGIGSYLGDFETSRLSHCVTLTDPTERRKFAKALSALLGAQLAA